MIGFREDGFEAFRYKLRTLSDRELIQFGQELRKKCFKPLADRCWKGIATRPRRVAHPPSQACATTPLTAAIWV